MGYNSFENVSFFAFLVGQRVHVNRIGVDSINSTVAVLNLSDYLDAPFARIRNLKIVQNEIYLVSADPATVQVLCLSNLTQPVKLYELAGAGYQPNRVYSHGPYVYIDNTIELLVVQTFGHIHTDITSIPYTSQVGG